MLREDLLRCTALAAGLVLTGCGGGLAMTDAPSRSAKAEERRVEVAPAPVERRTEERRAAAREERALPAPTQVEAAGAGDALAHGPYHVPPERAKDVDLEWNQELPPPPQDQVVPPPAPWKPAAQAEASLAPEIGDVWPNKGPEVGGEVVVIKGRNLRPTQVLFGMAPARILETSPEAVKVAAPQAGAGEVPVVLTNADGAYAVATHAFRYYR